MKLDYIVSWTPMTFNCWTHFFCTCAATKPFLCTQFSWTHCIYYIGYRNIFIVVWHFCREETRCSWNVSWLTVIYNIYTTRRIDWRLRFYRYNINRHLYYKYILWFMGRYSWHFVIVARERIRKKKSTVITCSRYDRNNY